MEIKLGGLLAVQSFDWLLCLNALHKLTDLAEFANDVDSFKRWLFCISFTVWSESTNVSLYKL